MILADATAEIGAAMVRDQEYHWITAAKFIADLVAQGIPRDTATVFAAHLQHCAGRPERPSHHWRGGRPQALTARVHRVRPESRRDRRVACGLVNLLPPALARSSRWGGLGTGADLLAERMGITRNGLCEI